jgi:hypothetical protein
MDATAGPRWKRYYEANKEKVKERNRERYYAKLGKPVPEQKVERAPPVPKPKPTPEEIAKMESLLEQLRTLVPYAMKKTKKKGSE